MVKKMYYYSLNENEVNAMIDEKIKQAENRKEIYSVACRALCEYQNREKITKREINKINEYLKVYGVNDNGQCNCLIAGAQLVYCYSVKHYDYNQIVIADYRRGNDHGTSHLTVAYKVPIDYEQIKKWCNEEMQQIEQLKLLRKNDEMKQYIKAVNLLNDAPFLVKAIIDDLQYKR